MRNFIRTISLVIALLMCFPMLQVDVLLADEGVPAESDEEENVIETSDKNDEDDYTPSSIETTEIEDANESSVDNSNDITLLSESEVTPEVIASGTCGDQLTWDVFDDKTLVISGSGDMTNFSSDYEAPWSQYTINSVCIMNGVTSIGDSAFYDSGLQSIEIPESIVSIGNNAFRYAIDLRNIDLPNSVTSIGDGAFHDSGLQSIEIPESVTSIGANAFSETGITSIDLPNSITSIGNGAFSEMYNLSSVVIPGSVVNIGEGLFETEGSKLTSVVIEDGITYISNRMFASCDALTSLSIPESVTSIGESAFYGCTSLNDIQIPNGVTSLGYGVFAYCESLKSIIIPDNITYIGVYAFQNCWRLNSIIIPESVSKIDEKAFEDCDDLNDVYYAGTEEDWQQITIENGNSNLTKAVIHHNYGKTYTINYTWEKTEEGYSVTATSVCDQDPTIVQSETVVAISKTNKAATCAEDGEIQYTASFIDKQFETQVKKETISAIGHNYSLTKWTWSDDYSSATALFTCQNDKSHTQSIEAEVTSEALTYWKSYTATVTAADGTVYTNTVDDRIDHGTCGEEIEWSLCDNGTLIITGNGDMPDHQAPWASNSDRIVNVIIQDGVTGIGSSAFYECYNLRSVTIPDSVTRIGDDAFGFTRITSIVIPGSVTSMGSGMFVETSDLTDVVIEEGVTSIGDGAFTCCYGLTNIVLPESLTSIGAFAFEDCESLASINIPGSVTSIGESAFKKCSNLASIELPAGITEIENNAFTNCSSLTSLEIPEGTTSIGDNAFNNCWRVADVYLPESVTSIGEKAFYSCSSLSDVYYLGSPETWEKITIKSANKDLTDATIHYYYGKTFAYNYTWAATENGYAVTATETCNEDPSISHSETVQAVEKTIKNGSCLENGKVQYTASFSYNQFETQYKEEDIPATGHNYVVNKWIWSKDNSSASAFFVCKNDGAHMETKDAVITSETTEATCTTDGKTVYTASVSFEGKTYSDTKESTIAAAHQPGTPVEENRKNPTCEAAGSYDVVVYCTVCGEELSRTTQEIPVKGHDYVLSGWTWNESHTAATVVFTCKNDPTHMQSVNAVITSETVEPTCTKAGNTVYTATAAFDGKTYTDQNTVALDAKGHTPGTAVEEKGVEASCEAEGSYDEVVYCTTCGAELSRTAHTIPATGHNYVVNKWIWNKDYSSATAFFVCQNAASHSESLEATITAETTTPTCTVDGKTIYTAAVTFEGKQYTDTKETSIAAAHQPGTPVEENRKNPTCEATGSYDVVIYCSVCGEELSRTTQEIPVKGHDYELSEWTWNDDYSSASALFICKNDATHVTTIDAVISSKVVETRTIRTTNYTAKVILNGITYTSTECMAELLLPELISISSATIDIPEQTYTGKLLTPKPEVRLNDEELRYGEDYSVYYSNNLDAGTATITIIGEGDYTGKATRSFTIAPKKVNPAVTLSTTAYTYDGKIKKPSVSVKADGIKLTSSDYSVEYASGLKNVGKYKVTVTLKGNYTGSKSVYFKINPKGTTLATSPAVSKAITVKWKKQSTKMASSRITGYQIQLATDSKFTKNKKTVTVSGYSKTSKKITKLKGKTKYYIRIRTYKTVSGTKYYSPWSKVKTVTTKS